jgi:hypothetical protein
MNTRAHPATFFAVSTAGRSALRLAGATRIARYLAALGLPAKNATAAAAELARRAIFVRSYADDDPADATAYAFAVDEVERWLDHLAVACRAPHDAPAPRGLVAWHVRSGLAAHPEAFLRRSGLPESLVAAIRSLPSSAAPPEAPLAVRTACLDAPANAVRRHWWRRPFERTGIR